MEILIVSKINFVQRTKAFAFFPSIDENSAIPSLDVFGPSKSPWYLLID